MRNRSRFIKDGKTPRDVWQMWQVIIKHDKTSRSSGKGEYGSDKLLAERLIELGYFESRELKDYGNSLSQIRRRIEKYGITEESEIDYGIEDPDGIRTNRAHYVQRLRDNNVEMPNWTRKENK